METIITHITSGQQDTNTFDNDWFEKLQIAAKKIGARVHLLTTPLNVDWFRNYHEATIACGEPGNGYPDGFPFHESESCYPSPTKDEKTSGTYVFLSWPQGKNISYENVVNFGTANGLIKTVPREVLALGEQFPDLYGALGDWDESYGGTTIVETTGDSPDSSGAAWIVWTSDKTIVCHFSWRGFADHKHSWLLFRKGELLKA